MADYLGEALDRRAASQHPSGAKQPSWAKRIGW